MHWHLTTFIYNLTREENQYIARLRNHFREPSEWFKFSGALKIRSHVRCSIKEGILQNFAKFTGKYLWQNFFLNKAAGLTPATLLKKRLWQRCFPVNFEKFLRTPFLQDNPGQSLLE